MAISDSIKTDLLYKKLFGVAKSDTAANKSPSNEATASPFINRGDKTWTQASLIPTTAAAVTSVVQAYTTTARIQCTADTTSVAVGGVYPTWKTGLTDWIPPEFDTANVSNTYRVQVYYGASGVSNPASTGGTQIFADGSGNAGEWYFDYQAGTLHFLGNTPIPTGMTGSSVIYIYGYRYVGLSGFAGSTLSVNNLRKAYTTTATAAGSTTLTNASTQVQHFTGSTTQTVVLPVASTLVVGDMYHIENNSTGNLTVNSSGGNLVATVLPGTSVDVTCILASGTTAASWDSEFTGFATVTGTGSAVLSTSPQLTTSVTTNSSSFDLLNTTATTVNAFGAATTLSLGASTGTATVNNPTVTLANATALNINGASPVIATTSTTASVFNSTVTTLNIGGAATALNLGASTGTATVANPTVTLSNATALNLNGASPVIATTSTTASVFNSTVTTLNIGGAATTLALGASTGTTTIANPTVTLSNATALNLNGASPSIVTSSTGTASVFNTNALTGNLFGAASTITIGSTTHGRIQTSSSTVTITAGTNTANASVSLVPQGTGTVDVNNKRITSVADPTQAQDAATKAYVDSLSNGLDVKQSVRAATTAALTATYNNGSSGVGATLTNAGTQAAFALDSINLSSGDRVLIKDQAAALQNGVYTVTTVGSASVNWVLTRATDFDNSPGTEVGPGVFFFVEEGTTNQDNGYVINTDSAITIGTSAITFSQFSGAGQITAGAGLTKSGNTIDAVGTANRITVNADSIDIASTYVGQATITTLGTIGTGVWQGTIVGPTYGGTGVNNGSNTLTLAGNVSHAGAFTQTFTATANTSLTLPTTGTLATLAGTETFTNKTLTAPVIATIVNTGTLTLPTSTDTLVGRATTDTLTNKTLTSPSINTPTIAGGTHTALTSLGIRDTSAAFDVTIAAVSSVTLTAARTLTLDMVNAARTLKLAGNIDIAGNLTTAGAVTHAGSFTQTFTATANTSVTLPTTGTLATLAGSEALSNKTITASSFAGSVAATTLSASGAVTLTSTTDASAVGTAAVVLSGGLSVAKAMYIGTNITGAGAATSTLDGFNIDGGTY